MMGAANDVPDQYAQALLSGTSFSGYSIPAGAVVDELASFIERAGMYGVV